jgi:7-cyano-7-deazaguanine reductase
MTSTIRFGPEQPSRDLLETFANPAMDRNVGIRIRMPEFTCLCPKTGQPDFAEMLLEYVPDRTCIELKSLKLYIWSYRNEGAYHEAVTNRIRDDLVAVLTPRFLRLTSQFNVRGGLHTTVSVEFRKPDWSMPPAIPPFRGGAV